MIKPAKRPKRGETSSKPETPEVQDAQGVVAAPVEAHVVEASPSDIPEDINMVSETHAAETAAAVEDVPASHAEFTAVPDPVAPAAFAAEAPFLHSEHHEAGAKAQDTTNFQNTLKEMLNMDKAIKTAEEFVAFNQGNVEAFLKAGQIWATGVQDLGKHIAASTQAQMDETMATVKALSSVKSLKEAIDLQTSLSKAAMEKALAETSKLADATTKLAEQAMAPITERVTMATEKFARPIV